MSGASGERCIFVCLLHVCFYWHAFILNPLASFCFFRIACICWTSSENGVRKKKNNVKNSTDLWLLLLNLHWRILLVNLFCVSIYTSIWLYTAFRLIHCSICKWVFVVRQQRVYAIDLLIILWSLWFTPYTFTSAWYAQWMLTGTDDVCW